MWARTTLFAIDGHWGEGTVSDLVVTAYHQDKQVPSLICIGTSTWQRSSDISLPARIKTGTNYQVARLARMEGRDGVARKWCSSINGDGSRKLRVLVC